MKGSILDTAHAFAELGLAADASETEVKAAWRRLVSMWHPDRNDSADAHARMQRINQAFKALRRTGFRAASGDVGDADRADSADRTHTAAAAPPPATPAQDARPRRTIARKIRLTLEEAASGCIRPLRGSFNDPCSACAGAGYRVLGGHCAACEGSGAVRQRAWFGWLASSTECAACHGGGIAREPCAACDGAGKTGATEYRTRVRIPPGVRSGDQLHVDGRPAQPGRAPQATVDFSLRIELIEHEVFTLADDGSVDCEIPVDGFAWIANRAIEVPTLAGTQTLPLQRDRLAYRLAGQGFPMQRRGPRGDLLVTIVPLFPQRLSTDQEILLDQLIATSSGPEGHAGEAQLRIWRDQRRAARATTETPTASAARSSVPPRRRARSR